MIDDFAAPRQRREDYRLATGQGRFVDDIDVGHGLVGLAVRSDFAHADILAIDTSRARAMDGVHAVLTGEDLNSRGIGGIPGTRGMSNSDGSDIFVPHRPVLAADRVRYIGEPVAFVVADTAHIAADAAELIEIDYAELASISDPVRAASGIPAIWPDAPGNQCFDWEFGDSAAVKAAFAEAAHRVEIQVSNPRMAICPIEPRAAIGIYHPESDSYTLYAQTQGVHSVRDTLAVSVLKIDPERLRVVTPDVGGSFGMKIFTYPEYALALIAARMLRQPVKWTATRSESFVSDVHGRGRVDTVRMALDGTGRMLALEYDALGDLGAYVSKAAALVPSVYAATVVGHTYRIAHIHFRSRGVFTNAPPTDAFRGAGKPETVSAIEQLIDKAARQTGIDRIALRRINLVRTADLPYAMPNGQVIDSGNFEALLDRTLELSDWTGFEARRRDAASSGLLRGIGLGMYLHSTGGNTGEISEVEFRSDSTIQVRSGTQAGGQGHESALAGLAAAALDVDESLIEVIQGDTGAYAFGSGTGGSSLIAIAGATVPLAARRALDSARAAASEILEASSADLEYSNGHFRIPGTDRAVSLAAIATRCTRQPSIGSCVGRAAFEGRNTTHPAGAYVAELECDPQTGALRIARLTGVDDIGRVLFPDMADGQLYGGWAQAVGVALMEHVQYDDASAGQPMNASFMDYGLPRADDMPSPVIDKIETLCEVNALGAKGAGEVACLGAPGALFNALSDMLGGESFSAFERPATPFHNWTRLRSESRK